MIKSVIINADDFGREQSRNHAIDDCFKKEYVTQTSLMVNNGKVSDEAVKMAFEGGYSDKVVLHINLTFGKPLTENIKSTPLCRDGVFVGMKDVIDTFFIYNKRYCRKAIKEECEAQIKKYLEYGFESYHLDSHNWVQTEIPIWREIYPLMKKYGFKSIRPMRKGLRVIDKHSKKSFVRGIYYRISDFLVRLTGYCKIDYSSGLEEFLDSSKDYEYVEIFCHPNIIEGKIYDTSWSYKGEDYKLMNQFNALLADYKNRCTYKHLFLERKTIK